MILKQKHQGGNSSAQRTAATLFRLGGLVLIVHCLIGVTVFICISNHVAAASSWSWLWIEQKILVYLLAPLLGFQSLMMVKTYRSHPSQAERFLLILVVDCFAFLVTLNLSAWYASIAFPLLCVLYVAQWVFQAHSSPQEALRQHTTDQHASPSRRKTFSSSARQKQKPPSSPEMAERAFKQVVQAKQSPPSWIVWYHGQADERFADQFCKHARLAVQQGAIQLWNIGDLQPGDLWQEKRTQAIQSATVAVLLISADFMTHDVIVNDELPQLLRRAQLQQTLIVPIYVSYYDLTGTGLEQFQPVNTRNKSLAKLGRADREEVLSKTVRAIRRHFGQCS